MKSLFRNRLIVTILCSQFFLQIGIWVRNFAVLLYVVDKTHGSPLAVSLISVAEFAPIFVFSFIGGTFADRWRPKRTMVWCDFLSAVSILFVLLALVFATWKAVFFATFASAILSQFSQPSGMRLFKLHVPEELTQAGMAMYQTLFSMFVVVGPLIGTLAYQRIGILPSIAVMGGAFLISAGALMFLPPDRAPERALRTTTLRVEMALGLRYVWGSRPLRSLSGAFLGAGLGVGLVQPLGVFLVTERLGLPKTDLQWLVAVNGAAMLLGGLMAMAASRRLSARILLLSGMIGIAVTTVLVGLSTELWLTLFLQFLGGLSFPPVQIGINTLILESTEEPFVGRVNGILNPLFMGGVVVTMTQVAWMMPVLSLVGMYIGSAVMFILGSLALIPLFYKNEKSTRDLAA